MSPVSQAQRKATDKYIKTTFDEIKISVPKGHKSIIQAAADAAGESLNGYVTTAITMRLQAPQGIVSIVSADADNPAQRLA